MRRSGQSWNLEIDDDLTEFDETVDENDPYLVMGSYRSCQISDNHKEYLTHMCCKQYWKQFNEGRHFLHEGIRPEKGTADVGYRSISLRR